MTYESLNHVRPLRLELFDLAADVDAIVVLELIDKYAECGEDRTIRAASTLSDRIVHTN